MTNSICVPTRLVPGRETTPHTSGETTKRVNGAKPVVSSEKPVISTTQHVALPPAAEPATQPLRL